MIANSSNNQQKREGIHQGLASYPSCVPAKLGINKKTFPLKKTKLNENTQAKER